MFDDDRFIEVTEVDVEHGKAWNVEFDGNRQQLERRLPPGTHIDGKPSETAEGTLARIVTD